MNADRTLLTDAQWARLSPLLPGQAHSPGVTARDTRLFVEAILWRLRCGVPWRDLPERFGPWHRVFVRFSRWKHSGVWARALAALQDETGLGQLQVDSTIVRAHQQPGWLLDQAAPELRRAGPAPASGPDRGPGRRLPASPQPARSRLAPRPARAGRPGVRRGLRARPNCRGRGAGRDSGQKNNRKVFIPHDEEIYKNRNQIERCFNRFKAYRAIATRFEKTALAYFPLVTLAAIRMWL